MQHFAKTSDPVAIALSSNVRRAFPALAACLTIALSVSIASAQVALPEVAAPELDAAALAPFATDHVLIKRRAGAAVDLAAVAGLGIVSLEAAPSVGHANPILAAQIGLDRWITARLGAGVDPVATVAMLRTLPGVESASLDGVGGLAEVTPNDPSFPLQWPLMNTGQDANGVAGAPDADLDATNAWSLATGGRSLIVAVLDSGVFAHDDLSGRVLPGWNVPQQNTNTADGCSGHGTHVSGIIGATGNNGVAIAGICWDVHILPVVVVNPCTGFESWVADGITWAVDHGAELINMSLQYNTGSAYLRDAVLYAAASGVPMIAAAGNSNATPPAFPARWPETIAVAATNNLDVRWTSSNYGPEIDVAAPGVAVLSLSSSNGTAVKTGTSMAAPHVTGVAALMRSVNSALTAEQLRTLITTTANDVNAPGFDNFTGWGRVNAFEAVQAAMALVSIPGDIDGDGDVDGADLALVLGQWGACEACQSCSADLDADCMVGGADLAIVLGHWSAL